MIIRKLRMVNFRGFCDKTIDFDDKPVVLISAANGIGKTTTIDAIEWCLTGEIGRLKTAFDTRSTNDTDRKKNTNGILKNRNSGNTSNVQVFLWIVDGENEIVLCREQKKDELNPDVSKVTIDGNEEVAEVFINQYVGNSFYNFHFCDVQKSFSVQNKKRGDLESLFSEFITNYDEQKQIAESIDVFADDVDRYIEDKEKQKVSQELIDSQEAQLVEAHEETNQIPYPSTIFYPGENVEIVSLSRDELIRQKTEIENCGYIIAQNKIRRLIDNDSLKSQMSLIIVESLSRDEYQKIGPTLSKFYNKLIRIGDNDGINIVHESDGISLIDDKGKNIVNILSNGQISVFLLAYFFAGINVRNEREKMKIFFIDDLTACMDDVNMLAFMDLLKYQISSKETMDQLFFVTCDNRISRLLKYKMNGHGIELKELLENDFKQ